MVVKPVTDNQNHDHESYSTRLWFSSGESEWIEEIGTRVNLPKGHILLEADVVPQCCYFILQGQVRTYEYTLSGMEKIYNIHEEGSFILEANMLARHAPPVAFETMTPVVLLKITREDLIKRIYIEPEVSLEIISSLSNKFLSSMEQLREMTHHDVLWQVCNLLITFADKHGEDYDGKILINETISQQKLANMLGVNRITLARAIKRLKEMRLIDLVNGFYCIRDMENLKEFMESEEA